MRKLKNENTETEVQRKKIEHAPILQTEIKQINWVDKRHYTSDSGKTYLPSVTSVLGAYPKGDRFHNWLKENGQNADLIVKQASREGTQTHELIEDFLNGIHIEWKSNNFPLIVWKMFLRFLEFYYTWNPEIISIEKRFFSKKIGAAGTCDLICKIDSETWIIDFKTSNALNHSYRIQGDVYRRLYEEESGEKVDKIGILWLKAHTKGKSYEKAGKCQGKNWSLVEVPQSEWAELGKDWKACKQLYKSSEPPKPYNVSMPAEVNMESINNKEFNSLMKYNGFDLTKRFK